MSSCGRGRGWVLWRKREREREITLRKLMPLLMRPRQQWSSLSFTCDQGFSFCTYVTSTHIHTDAHFCNIPKSVHIFAHLPSVPSCNKPSNAEVWYFCTACVTKKNCSIGPFAHYWVWNVEVNCSRKKIERWITTGEERFLTPSIFFNAGVI